jgi:hypothetical protein
MGICGSEPIPIAASEADAVGMELRESFKGLGSDNRAMISSLASRTSKVLDDVCAAYAERFSEPDEPADLMEDIKDETRFDDFFKNLSGEFTRTMVKMLRPQAELEAMSLRRAMCTGMNIFGTDELRLEEVLFFRSKEQIDAIKAAYEDLYGEEEVKSDGPLEGEEETEAPEDSEETAAAKASAQAWLDAQEPPNNALERDIRSEVGCLLLKMYLAALNRKDETGSPEADAAALYGAGQGKTFGTDEDTFAEVLGKAGPEHMHAIKNVYYEQYNRELADMIENEMGVFEAQLKAAALRIVGGDRDKSAHGKFLAGRFCKAAKHASLETFGTGMGTDDEMLQRLILTNRECGRLEDPRDPLSKYIPVFAVVDEYLKEMVPVNSPAESLIGLVGDETSGNYQILLETMIRKFQQPVDWNNPRNGGHYK